jgi:hypothetical protein
MRTPTKVVLATVSASAALAGLGVGAASASPAESDTVVVPAFYENIEPWDSITIPSLSCPTGLYLVNQDLSPGRLVPKGVEVQELR